MGAGILAATRFERPFYDVAMAVYIALLLLLAPDTLEERFIAALKSDLTTGTTEKTAPFIAPAIRDKLPPSRLKPVYVRCQANGKIISLKTDPNTPFGLEKKVRLLLVQEKAETHVVCRFDKNGQLLGYWFRPAPPRWTMRKVHEATGKWAGDWCWCVATPDASNVSSRGSKEFPIGSIFKLYVLAELAAQIEDGTISAEQRVKLLEERKSLPSGVLQAKPAGTEVTVAEMATKMISISDNTATDHLLHLVGRENIEKGLVRWHNSCPERNKPFLTTREMFLMKGGGKEAATGLSFAELCKRWPESDRATRMDWVTKMTAPFEKKTAAELLQPIGTGYAVRSQGVSAHLTLEWFARPQDICALLMDAWSGKLPGSKHFLEYYKTGTEVYPREGLKYYGFKGGSETNVMAMSAMAVGKRGEPIAVCVCRSGAIGAAAGREVQQVASALLRLWIEDQARPN
jgi:hypothetical protein